MLDKNIFVLKMHVNNMITGGDECPYTQVNDI